jgi:Uma2 family endonuclease
MSRAFPRFTSADLELMPDDGKRREVIDGELFVSKVPHHEHQAVCATLIGELYAWNLRTELGRVSAAPGVVFDDDDVIPDVVWCRRERLATALDEAGHFHLAPDLVVEVLSPGPANERRDRIVKLELYSRRAVLEYWIVDWPGRQVELSRRENLRLRLIATLREADTLESPFLPGFALPLERLFADVPRAGG